MVQWAVQDCHPVPEKCTGENNNKKKDFRGCFLLGEPQGFGRSCAK